MNKIGVTSGLRGHFAVIYDGDTGEPIQTGIGSFETAEEAAADAEDWSIAEEIPLDETTAQLLSKVR